MGMPWFRMYSEVLDDRKLVYAARDVGESRALVLGIWTGLLCLASQAPTRGLLLIAENVPYSKENLADELGVELPVFEATLNAFVKFNMVGLEGEIYYIAQWHKRQFASDNAYARVKKYREKKKETEPLPAEKQNNETYHGSSSPFDMNMICSGLVCSDLPEEGNESNAEAEVCRAWAEIRGGSLNSLEVDELGFLIEDHGAEAVLEGIRTVVKANRAGKPNINFLSKILRDPLPPKDPNVIKIPPMGGVS